MLFYPTKIFKRITDIKIEDLNRYNIKGLLVDVDNTMSTHGGQIPLENLFEWLSYIKSKNIGIYILSNARESRVQPFAEKVGLNYISLGTKPLPFGYIRGKNKLKLKSKNIAIIGDQLFTDVLGGKICLMKTFLVRPILLEEKRSFKIRRALENFYLKKIHNYKGE